MKKAFLTQLAALFFVISVVSPSAGQAQNREKFVISAHAGGINAVTGRATMRPHGNAEWQQLTIKEDLETGDVVRTGLDGRVEMLLNPGSYMRIGENSEFKLADNSLDKLDVHLAKGTAILEVTGADDSELFISVTTPHARLAIVRRGLYRLNVVPGDGTELIVRKGRVLLGDSQTKIKGGHKVVFSSSSFSVAKVEKADKKAQDPLDGWSKDRAHTLAQANSRLSGRMVRTLLTSLNDDWAFSGLGGRSGIWLFNLAIGGYTFLPFSYGWGSPYGRSYSSSFYNGYNGYGGYGYSPAPGRTSPTGGTGSGSVGGSGGSGGATPTYTPAPSSPPIRMPEAPRVDREPREAAREIHRPSPQ